MGGETAGVAAGSLGASARTLRDRIAAGSLRATDLARACVDRVAAVEGEVRAFAWFDPAHVMRQAEALDTWRASGRPLGPLHGLPVAVKDVFDTAGIPTENGTPIDAGRVPGKDAVAVQRLRAAGAIVLGKAATAELAFITPTATRNPANLAHTAGTSSSGSAAAVAAGMAPLALGTQTGGSIVRPASYCGVVGLKPSFGAIPRGGVLSQSPNLDTVGVFAADLADAAMLAEVLYGQDASDPMSVAAPAPRLLELALSRPPVTPSIAFVRGPFWDRAAPEVREALEEVAARLGDACVEAELPGAFAAAPAIRDTINLAEMARCFEGYAARGRDRLSALVRGALEDGERVLARDYLAALDRRRALEAGLEEIFVRCDAILTPAAAETAPRGDDTPEAGAAPFNGTWTLCGTPTVTLPLLEASDGLPIGVQLVGRRGDDGRLLRTAAWLAATLAASEDGT